MFKLLLTLLISLCLLFNAGAQVVNTQFGQVQGTLNGAVNQFLGIPFAKPPVDSLRWKAPLNPDPWTGILATNNFAPECPQKKFNQGSTADTIIGNEDCLYLNIWSPQLSGNLPVMVFIHGGGNQQGSAGEVNGGTQMYFGKNMSERGNVIVVTIQYRLGPLGFLVHPGLEPENPNNVSGNYAVLDQLLALNWIQNNIAAFGGDPSRVMIFGESAGGLNVGNLLTSPLANGLFQRAAIQSAAPVISSYVDATNKGIAYVDTFSAPGTDVQKIAYMRTLPIDSLVKYETSPLSGGAVGMNWQAVIDNIVFDDFPKQKFESGNFNKVPLIIGSNSEEMSLSAPQNVLPFMVTALINQYVPAPYQSQAAALYPPGTTAAEARESYVGILTDAQFTATTRRVARCVSQNQIEPVFRYFFTHKHAFSPLTELGSYHGMELFYVFNTWEDATLGSGPLFSPQDDSVQTNMLQYWVNFAATGNPNGPGLPVWPDYDAGPDCFLEIKATPDGSACGLRTAESDFWDAASNYSGCTISALTEDLVSHENLVIVPNPSSGFIELQIPNPSTEFSLNIMDGTGRKILTEQNTISLNLAGFANGFYMVEFRSSEKVLRTKLLIKR
ncbi:MAG: carboxylesterase family protein [Bacteroidia bacterium]|nr:carboxylesterase family protein [Bacteroidia bacterium]